MALTGRQKAEVLISILDRKSIDKLSLFLPDEYASILETKVQNLPPPSPEALMAVLKEVQSVSFLPKGPQKKPQKKEEFIPGMEGVSHIQSKLLGSRLLTERPQTAAFILSFLPKEKAEDVISYVPEKRREIEALLKNIKRNPISSKLKDTVFDVLMKG